MTTPSRHTKVKRRPGPQAPSRMAQPDLNHPLAPPPSRSQLTEETRISLTTSEEKRAEIAAKRHAENEAALADVARCQHPRSMAVGVCKNKSVGEFDIPPSYTYITRHAYPPELPRPRARLCRQHRGMVEMHAAGHTQALGHTHQAHCDVCRHKDGEMVSEMWLEYKIGTGEAIKLLSVSYHTWYSHVKALGLDEKKMTNRYRRKMLLQVVEKGLRTKTHSVATSLKAMRELAHEVGDRPQDVTQHNHTVVGALALIGSADITKLPHDELARHLEELAIHARRLGERAATNGQPALDSGSDDDRTIDLPASAVRELADE